MLLREILLRERAVRKELSDSPNTSKRYGCASIEGSKRAKLRTIQYPSTFSSTFFKKEDFSYLRKTGEKRKKRTKGEENLCSSWRKKQPAAELARGCSR
jgi:hypothetical protein